MDRPKVTAKEWNALKERSPRAADALLDWIEEFIGTDRAVVSAEITEGTLVVETLHKLTDKSSSLSYPLTSSPPVWP